MLLKRIIEDMILHLYIYTQIRQYNFIIQVHDAMAQPPIFQDHRAYVLNENDIEYSINVCVTAYR